MAQDPRAFDRQLTPLLTKPGVKRDGTSTEGDYYSDSVWVRFNNRGKPKKIGGYKVIKDSFRGPIRALYPRGRLLTTWHPAGMDYGELDESGSLANFSPGIMPGGFVGQNDYVWSVDSIYNAVDGNVVLVAHPGRNLSNIESEINTDIMYAAVDQSTYTVSAFANAGKQVSGGIVVLQPYLFAYGNKGEISNSDVNKPANNWLPGGGSEANTDHVSGTKVVQGLPIKGGSNAPAGLFWSLDSLIRVSFVGGAKLFNYDPIGQISILSPNSVIEYDGIFYWAAVGRFMMFNGTIREVPNALNLDYFFDNLNFAQRQLVWAMKDPKHGEIWWFYPTGTDTVCTKAVIFNVRLNTWYDAAVKRSAGMYAQTSRFPVMADAEIASSDKKVTVTNAAGTFIEGDRVVAGSAIGIIHRSTLSGGAGDIYIKSTATFPGSGTITSDQGGSATISSAGTADLFRVWLHEFGWDRAEGDVSLAIPSLYETQEFGIAAGAQEGSQGTETSTILDRIEPDFTGLGELTIELVTKDFAQAQEKVVESKPCVIGETPRIDYGKEGRLLKLRVSCNHQGANFEAGTLKTSLRKGSRGIP